MGGILPLLLLGGKGLKMGGGLIGKVFKYLVLGPVGMLFGGKFNLMDYILIPKIAPMFSSIFGGLGLGGGVGAAAPSLI